MMHKSKSASSRLGDQGEKSIRLQQDGFFDDDSTYAERSPYWGRSTRSLQESDEEGRDDQTRDSLSATLARAVSLSDNSRRHDGVGKAKQRSGSVVVEVAIPNFHQATTTAGCHRIITLDDRNEWANRKEINLAAAESPTATTLSVYDGHLPKAAGTKTTTDLDDNCKSKSYNPETKKVLIMTGSPIPERASYDPPPSQNAVDNYDNSVEKVFYFGNQDYKSIKNELLKKKNELLKEELFQDPYFAVYPSLLCKQSLSQHDTIEWLRPAELCQRLGLAKGPEFFVDGADRFDIVQGELGDCGALCAMCNLAEDQDRFEEVVPSDQGFDKDYAGIFRFRFWYMGWRAEVVVDDRLPVCGNSLLYLHSSDKSEFWSALLEKAYAKLRGSYNSLVGGDMLDAAVAFTGGIPQIIVNPGAVESGALFRCLQAMAKNGAFIGSSVDETEPEISQIAERLGLFPRHAYTITSVVEVQGFQLIRVRNPWGNEKKWKGDWGDGHQSWNQISEETKKELKLSFSSNGEFYMSLEHFILFFKPLFICHHLQGVSDECLRLADMEGEERTLKLSGSYSGHWNSPITIDREQSLRMGEQELARMSQYFFDVPTTSTPQTVLISLEATMAKVDVSLSIFVYGCESADVRDRLDKDFFRTHARIAPVNGSFKREVGEHFRLLPGRYCVIPVAAVPYEDAEARLTFARPPGREYLLRIFVESEDENVFDLWQRQELQAHNEKRALHGAPPLTLDVQLCKYAQQRAYLTIKSDFTGRRQYGENAHYTFPRRFVAGESATFWYSRSEVYVRDRPSTFGAAHCFTQLVWKETTRMGIARAYLPDAQCIMMRVVACYDPPGNREGAYDENVGPLI